MAVRPTLAALIVRVRTLIGDGSGVLTDQQIADALDIWRSERRWVALRPVPTYGPGGTTTFLDYYSDAQYWEDDSVLQNLSYTTIAPALSEPLVGHWQFATQPAGIGVRATGKTYDVYASAADLLESWAALVKLDFAFGSMQDKFERNQKFDMMIALAERYRGLAQPHSSRMVQTDAAPEEDGGGVVYPVIHGSDYS